MSYQKKVKDTLIHFSQYPPESKIIHKKENTRFSVNFSDIEKMDEDNNFELKRSTVEWTKVYNKIRFYGENDDRYSKELSQREGKFVQNFLEALYSWQNGGNIEEIEKVLS